MIRIVRMTFKESETSLFLKIFDESKEKIRAFEGCNHLELLQDVHDSNVYSTYSYWESEGHLNQYRKSELFGIVWSKTKKLFSEKPVAHSYQQKVKLD